MTHFTATADTYDFAYGQTNSRSLAINSPGLAVNNADNHEYIAENTPGLSCGTAGVRFTLFCVN
jgi:peptidyl-Lys metalloendopeptidase